MRKIQATIGFTDFTHSKKQLIKGYVDGNSIEEVLHELLKTCNNTFNDGVTFAEFCDRIKDFDERTRMGRTELDVICE